MPEPDYKKLAENLDAFLTQTNAKKVVFAEEDHGAGSDTLKMLADPNIQAVLQKHEIFDFALEARAEQQGLSDKIGRGLATPQQLGEAAVQAYKDAGDPEAESAREIWEARGSFIQASDRRGFTVHLVDKQDDLKGALKSLDDQAAMSQTRMMGAGMAIEDAMKKGKLTEADMKNFEAGKDAAVIKVTDVVEKGNLANPLVKATQDAFMKPRLAGDPELAKFIEERTDGRNVAVLYGAYHANDLRQMLGPDTVSISLNADHQGMVQTQEERKVRGEVQPNAMIDLQTGDFRTAGTSQKESPEMRQANVPAPQ